MDRKSRTIQGVTMGTFGYMSPEQMFGETVDERTDVYSIGVIALETLTGRLALDGPNFHRTIEHGNRRLIEPAATDAQVRLARAMERALFPVVARRFASIAEMRAELVPAIRECPEVPLPLTTADARAAAGPIGTAAVTGSPANAETANPQQTASQPPRNRVM